MKHEIPLMLEQGGGAIVNTSSGAGIRGFKGGGAYVAAKHGVVGLTKSAALDGRCRMGRKPQAQGIGLAGLCEEARGRRR